MNAAFNYRRIRLVAISLVIVAFLSSCSDPSTDRFQGYVEGEFVYVASPLAGQLETLSVQRGQQVTTGQPLFSLDETAEKAARDMAEAALVLSEAEFKRQSELLRRGPASAQDYDRARSTGGTTSGACLRHTLSPGRVGCSWKASGRAFASAKHQSAGIRSGNTRRVNSLR